MEKKFFVDNSYNTRVLESDNFIVIPTLGSLVQGWLLIVPKEFYLNASEFSTELLFELELLVRQLEKRVLPRFGEGYVLFEHGPKNTNSLAGCGVDYAHLHFVPTTFDLKAGLEFYLGLHYEWNMLSSILDLHNSHFLQKDYLYLRDQSGSHFITHQESIPSQTFRKVIAHYLGTPHFYDWKKNSFAENITSTIHRITV